MRVCVCMYLAFDKVLQQLLSKLQTGYVFFKESQQTDLIFVHSLASIRACGGMCVD